MKTTRFLAALAALAAAALAEGLAPAAETGPKGPDVVEKWTFRLTKKKREAATCISLHDGLVYITFHGDLYCLDAKTGEKKFIRDGKGKESLGAPVIVDGVMYLGHPTYLAAEDPQTQKEKWRFTLEDRPVARDGKYNSPTLPVVTAGQVLFIPTTTYSDENQPPLIALDRATGKEQWRFASANKTGLATPPAAGCGAIFVGVHASVAAGEKVGERTWKGQGDAAVVALDPKTGKELWRAKTGKPVVGRLIVDEAKKEVHALGHRERLYVIDAAAKTLKSEITLENVGGKDRYAGAGPSRFKDLLLFGGYQNPVVAYDLAAGKTAWVFKTPKYGAFLHVGVADGVVYTGDHWHDPGTRVFGIDAASGKELWSFSPTSVVSGTYPDYRFIVSQPVLSDGMMIFVDAAAVVRALADK